MARGKEAVLAERRRVEARDELIDRLTSELTEAKLRARKVEAEAAKVPALVAEGAKLRQQIESDELLTASLEANRAWKRIATEDLERRRAAFMELRKFFSDLRAPLGTGPDRTEFLKRRYPALLNALTAGQGLRSDDRVGALRDMPEDERKRLERLMGVRATFRGEPDRDMAEIVADVLEARQLGFTGEDVWDLVLG